MNRIEKKSIKPIDFETPEIEANASNIKPIKLKEIKEMKETKEVLSFIFSLVYGTSKSLKDGKFQATDIFNYTGAIKKLPSAISGIEQVPTELMGLNVETIESLKLFIVDEFNLENKDQEEAIEKVIVLAADFAKAVISFK